MGSVGVSYSFYRNEVKWKVRNKHINKTDLKVIQEKLEKMCAAISQIHYLQQQTNSLSLFYTLGMIAITMTTIENFDIN